MAEDRGFRGPRFPRRRLGLVLVCLLASSSFRVQADEVEAATGGQRKAGRLEGLVTVGPELSSRRLHFNLYADLAQPQVVPALPQDVKELANVVIYFESAPTIDGLSPRKSERPTMRQEGLTFVPHVLAIPKGTSVEFPNGDALFHNVFSLSKPASFDLGRYPQGSSRSVRFDKPGMVKVFCHIHSDMSAVIMVLQNPFFAVPDEKGRYSVEGIPPGEYQVVGWHERARPLRRIVRILPGQTSSVDFRIPLTEPAAGE